jgi:hypothetical protein
MAGMEANRMTEEIRLRGREVTVGGPILEVRPDGDDAFDAGGAAFPHPRGQTPSLDGVFRVTMGVQQAHAVIRLCPEERARPQPCLEKTALPCTLALCTIG